MTHEIVNYDGGITTTPQQLVYPKTVEEIQDILRNADRFPGPVRAMGSYHSLTPCASTEGTVVNLSHMNRILGIDLATMTFTAQSGLQIFDAATALRRLNLQLITNVEIGNMTLGAAACCQSKDGLDGGEVNAHVIKIKWVTPSGDLAEASETGEPQLLRLVRSSYGLCGVVYEVTFRVKPVEAIHFTYIPRRVEALTQGEVDAIIDSAEGLVCWTVGKTANFQVRSHAASAGTVGTLAAAIRRRLWNHTEAHAGQLIDRYAPKSLHDVLQNTWFLGSRTVFSALHLIGGFTLDNPDKIVDYRSTPPSCKYAFTFWAFPRQQWLATLKEYLAFADQHFEKYGFRCNMALGSYFIRQHTSSLLSYANDGDIFSIDPIHAYTDKPAWDRFLQEFNAFSYDRNGIPLLNQSPFVEKKHVEKAFGERWREFSHWVKTQDPSGRMLNPFFAALLSD
ncbi:MAG: FAD-dependent oxidoreductase [Xanthobacteraceae bacterium]